MPSKEELKSKVCQEIDRRSEEIIGVAKTIWKNPELGYKEVKTSRLVAQEFAEMGIPYRDGLAITGVKGVVQGGSEGPTVAVLGELDAVPNPGHPEADPETGAVHTCGHHLQIGHVIGVAAGLTGSGVLPSLSGRVAFMAVPTEEPLEFEFRNNLRKEGKLTYWVGKQELIKLGEFDDIDIAMMTHSWVWDEPEGKFALGVGPAKGCLMFKCAEFVGGARAGANAWRLGQGKNINAALTALSAIKAQPETFLHEDGVTVWAVITKGGWMVASFPEVQIEFLIRANTLETLKDASEKVDRALRAGAQAAGAMVRIITWPGYPSMREDPILQELYRANAISLVGEKEVVERPNISGASDMCDVSNIMPAIHPYVGGITPSVYHGNDYQVADHQVAVIEASKAMAMLVIDLLADGAVKGKEVLAKSKPEMTKQEYLALQESLMKEEEYQG